LRNTGVVLVNKIRRRDKMNLAPAWKKYNEALAQAMKKYNEVRAPALKEYEEEVALAWKKYEEEIAQIKVEFNKVAEKGGN